MKTVIVGLSYGDEGKARVVGYFAKDCDWTVRYNGGGNAGHTVYDDDGREHKLHYLSAGAVFGKKVCIDTGAVVDLSALKEEMDNLGRPVDLYISKNVHRITFDHVDKDSDGSGLGSTKKGIAYVYGDRALRKGERITRKMLEDWNIKATLYSGLPPVADDESVIFEGAQGLMLDIDYGAYPYVTSSSIMPNMVHRVDRTIGVFKAYTTRVGDGPPYHPDIESIRVAGNEYGTTTGRPRRCAWNDIDELQYAISIVRPDQIVVTKMDILNDVEDIQVYMRGKLFSVGNLDNYKNFLLETFPQITYFSESPKGDLIEV
jgi:adenylosuccinate synthase